MLQSILTADGFSWFDIVDPTPAEFEKLAEEHKLPKNLVYDCLDPEHLPKFEQHEGISFAILRAYDEACPHESDTVQELTRKLAIFYSENTLITIHRKEQPYFTTVKNKWSTTKGFKKEKASKIAYEIIRAAILTYETPINRALDTLEELEMGAFSALGSKPFKVQEAYYLKRKAFVFRRLMRTMQDQIPKMAPGFKITASQTQDLREQAESMYFYSDELTESTTSLLNLHISLSSQQLNEASHRTNEVMRVLTIFSVFLLPLNVITGIYGMNFEHMPELKWPFGYPSALLAMLTVVTCTYFWFHRKGWMK